MKKLLFFIILINQSCFSMELNYSEKQIPIFSNNSNQPIFLDKSAIELSELLKTFFATRKDYKKENIKFDINYEDLKNAVDIINIFVEAKNGSSKEDLLTNELQDLSLQDLINTYFIIDLFKINELEEYLGLLFNKPEFIKQLSQLDQEELKHLEFVKTKAFLPSQASEPLLKNVNRFYLSPDGLHYFVIYNNNSGQLFDNNGNPIGNILNNIFSIGWLLDGLHYFVIYNNNSRQLFDNDGNPVGNNIFSIDWSSGGLHYFVKFNDYSGQLFDNKGNPIGNSLDNVLNVDWSPDGLHYFVKFNDYSGQLFDNKCNPVGNPLDNILYIDWSLDGSHYFVKFNDNSGQLFDNGNPVGNILDNILYIQWSPDGLHYFVKFRDDSGQLFDNGNPIGNNNVLCIDWSPDGSNYFVRYNNGLCQLFDNGNPIGNILNNVYFIEWLPDGSHYFVRYNNGLGQLFDKNSNLTLYFPTIKQYKCGHNTLMFISNNNLYKNSLNFLVEERANGYQIYRAKGKLPISRPLKSKPLWLDANSFAIKKEDGQEEYYSYQELSLPDLVNQ